MVSLRSSTRSNTARSAANHPRASSSSAKAGLITPSDENAPQRRRALGEVQNVLADRKATAEASGSRRKPLSDRNAPVPLQRKADSKKGTGTAARPGASAVKLSSYSAARPKRHIARPATEPKLVGPPSTAPSASQRTRAARTASPFEVSHIDVPSVPSSLADVPLSAQTVAHDSLSAQIEAAERRSTEAEPSHEQLSRLSPGLDSDDLEYFDVSILQQVQDESAAAQERKHNQSSSAKDGDSDAEGRASRGSSDKENVPPPAARPDTNVGNRQSARSRAGVLREQPTHSTPISQKRKAYREELPTAGQILNDIFDTQSNRSSQLDSPGAARRAQPLTASAQQLRDYQDQGVDKVKAWKAAGHDAAHRSRKDSPTAGSDAGSEAGSWPAEDRSTDGGADVKPDFGVFDEEGMDEFGFLLAERDLKNRSTRALAESFEYEAEDLDNASDVFVDLPTDPFSTSDDRRLAEHAFGRMSSPASHQQGFSVIDSGSDVPLGHHRLQPAPKGQPVSASEDESALTASTPPNKPEPQEPEADTSARRVTRSATKRKSDAKIIVVESDDSVTFSHAVPTRQTAKSKRSMTGIPLKRNETKEQKMLEMLAAQGTSSPAHSSAPSSPQAVRTRKSTAESPAAKKARMDDLLSCLPRRKPSTTATKARASGSRAKTATRASPRKGKAAPIPKVRPSAKGRGKKAKPAVSKDSDDESEEEPTHSTRSKATKGLRRAVEPQNNGEDDWRTGVNSSQIHSDDSERTKRLKEFRAAEKYRMEVEVVL